MLQRKADSHKGDYGHVLIIAGSARYSGAAVLAASAAMRAGAGLVTLAVPRGIHNALLKIKPPEIMTLPLAQTPDGGIAAQAAHELTIAANKADVLVIGPGLGAHPATQRLVRGLVQKTALPIVIDADGLNAVSGHTDCLAKSRGDLILTPHPGELARLRGLTTAAVQSRRKGVALSAARAYNTTVILKGHRTIVASPSGRYYINNSGNPGMATAGSGDVLAGIVGALRGQGLDSYDAACCGAYLHGRAGDIAAQEKTQPGMIASDIIASIPLAWKLLVADAE